MRKQQALPALKKIFSSLRTSQVFQLKTRRAKIEPGNLHRHNETHSLGNLNGCGLSEQGCVNKTVFEL